jgi:hypothetical protein
MRPTLVRCAAPHRTSVRRSGFRVNPAPFLPNQDNMFHSASRKLFAFAAAALTLLSLGAFAASAQAGLSGGVAVRVFNDTGSDIAVYSSSNQSIVINPGDSWRVAGNRPGLPGSDLDVALYTGRHVRDDAKVGLLSFTNPWNKEPWAELEDCSRRHACDPIAGDTDKATFGRVGRQATLSVGVLNVAVERTADAGGDVTFTAHIHRLP